MTATEAVDILLKTTGKLLVAVAKVGPPARSGLLTSEFGGQNTRYTFAYVRRSTQTEYGQQIRVLMSNGLKTSAAQRKPPSAEWEIWEIRKLEPNKETNETP